MDFPPLQVSNETYAILDAMPRTCQVLGAYLFLTLL